MPHNRFFLPAFFRPEESLSLQGDEMHHMKNVMRLKKDDAIEIVNGQGQLALAEIVNIGKHDATVFIQQILQQEAEVARKVDVALSLIRLPRLEWALEKLTELGVNSITLFAADRSELETISENKLARLRGITIAALKQCGALYLPSLNIYPHLSAIPPINGVELAADFTETPIEKPATSCRIFIGPEAGWSETEKTLLKSRTTPVRIAQYVLRAETAAIVAAAHLTF